MARYLNTLLLSSYCFCYFEKPLGTFATYRIYRLLVLFIYKETKHTKHKTKKYEIQPIPIAIKLLVFLLEKGKYIVPNTIVDK